MITQPIALSLAPDAPSFHWCNENWEKKVDTYIYVSEDLSSGHWETLFQLKKVSKASKFQNYSEGIMWDVGSYEATWIT